LCKELTAAMLAISLRSSMRQSDDNSPFI
jgi:hypothetical protein